MPHTRINRIGLEYQITGDTEKTKVVHQKKQMVVDMPIDTFLARWYMWQMLGQNISVAFHMLNADQREFLITAITPEEWTEIFKEDEDEEQS